jgi:hypothetical protein
LQNRFSIIRQMFLPIGFHCNINFLQNFVLFIKSDFCWTFLCLIVIPNACLCRAHASTKSSLSQLNGFFCLLLGLKLFFFVSIWLKIMGFLINNCELVLLDNWQLWHSKNSAETTFISKDLIRKSNMEWLKINGQSETKWNFS